jgi:hypothetical protein
MDMDQSEEIREKKNIQQVQQALMDALTSGVMRLIYPMAQLRKSKKEGYARLDQQTSNISNQMGLPEHGHMSPNSHFGREMMIVRSYPLGLGEKPYFHPCPKMEMS